MLEGWGRVKRKIFIKGFKTLSRCSCALCPTTQPQPQLKNSETTMLSCCAMWHHFSVYLPTPLCLHTTCMIHTRRFCPMTTSSLCLAAIILNLKCKKRILWQHFLSGFSNELRTAATVEKNAFPRTSETRQTGFVSIQQARILCWKLKAPYYIHASADYRKSFNSFLANSLNKIFTSMRLWNVLHSLFLPRHEPTLHW